MHSTYTVHLVPSLSSAEIFNVKVYPNAPFAKIGTQCCEVNIEWTGPATHMEESLHSTRWPFLTCLSGRAQSAS